MDDLDRQRFSSVVMIDLLRISSPRESKAHASVTSKKSWKTIVNGPRSASRINLNILASLSKCKPPSFSGLVAQILECLPIRLSGSSLGKSLCIVISPTSPHPPTLMYSLSSSTQSSTWKWKTLSWQGTTTAEELRPPSSKMTSDPWSHGWATFASSEANIDSH